MGAGPFPHRRRNENVEPPAFDVDRAQVYYMAAEACRTFDQESAAERFYQAALEHTREMSGVGRAS